MSKIRKLVAMSPRGWWRLADAYRLLWRARGYRDDRLDEVSRLVKPATARQGPASALSDQQRRVIWHGVHVVDMAARHPVAWASCLRRSLALVWWLEARGIDARLRIGARKEASSLVAHAWVEYDGIVLNDRQTVPAIYSPLVLAAGRSGPVRWGSPAGAP